MRISTTTNAAKWALYVLAALSFIQSGGLMTSGDYFSGVIFATLGSVSFALVMAIGRSE